MDKQKKCEPKKILVRNTVLPLQKTRVIVDEKPQTEEKKSVEPEHPGSNCNLKTFQAPEPNSVYKIVKQIDKVGKATTHKASSGPDLAYYEKVTRKINFPADQPIYKDLIPLQVPAKTPQPSSSREPLPRKDKEPMLANFAKVKPVKEYIYIPTLKADKRQTLPPVNNLRLYKVLQANE